MKPKCQQQVETHTTKLLIKSKPKDCDKIVEIQHVLEEVNRVN